MQSGFGPAKGTRYARKNSTSSTRLIMTRQGLPDFANSAGILSIFIFSATQVIELSNPCLFNSLQYRL